MTPYPFVLYWPFITKRWEVYRLITCFLYAGKGIGLLFDLFFFFRNSTDLEGNTFFRRTSKYAWALFIMAAEIIALNYPLQTPILWKPFLNSLTVSVGIEAVHPQKINLLTLFVLKVHMGQVQSSCSRLVVRIRAVPCKVASLCLPRFGSHHGRT